MRIESNGFTLVEIIITIAVIIVLSSISVPIYKDYRKNTAMAEGYILLAAIRDAQLRYFDEYGNFTNWCMLLTVETCYDPILGIDARKNQYFTNFCAGYNGGTSDGNLKKYYFGAIVRSKRYGVIQLKYNVTAGATFE